MTVLLLAGCEYDAPLSTEATIVIDPALLGSWEVIPEPDENPNDLGGSVVVLRFSGTEYLVHDSSGQYFRAFLVDVGGHRCLQLEHLGSEAGPRREPAGYLVARCTIEGDQLVFSLLNDRHVPLTWKTTADIRAAIVANRDKADLFEPIARFRRRLLPTLALPQPTPDQRSQPDHVETAAFAPGGRLLLVGLRSGHAAAINLVDGTLAWSVAAHDKPVHSLAFGSNDRWVLTAGDDLRATLRRCDTGGERVSFEAVPMRQVYEIALSADATFAATRGFDGFGKVWDLRLNREVVELNSRGFAFGARERLLVSTPGLLPGAEIHSLPPDQPPRQILPDHMIRGIAIDGEGTTVAAAGGKRDGSATVWLVDPVTGRLRAEIAIPKRPETTDQTAASSPAFSADGRFLAVTSSDGQIVRIDVAKERTTDAWNLPKEQIPQRVGFIAEDVWATSLAELTDSVESGVAPSATTWLFRLQVRQPVWTMAGAATFSAEHPVAAAVAPDGDLLLVARSDGKTRHRLRPFANGRAWQPRDP